MMHFALCSRLDAVNMFVHMFLRRSAAFCRRMSWVVLCICAQKVPRPWVAIKGAARVTSIRRQERDVKREIISGVLWGGNLICGSYRIERGHEVDRIGGGYLGSY